MTKKYEIECLQGAPLDSWSDGPFTEAEIKEKFWEYARVDGSLDEVGEKPHWFDDEEALVETPPEDFTLDFIKDIWQIDLIEKEVLTVKDLLDILSKMPPEDEVVFNHGETILKFEGIGRDDYSDIVDIFIKE